MKIKFSLDIHTSRRDKKKLLQVSFKLILEICGSEFTNDLTPSHPKRNNKFGQWRETKPSNSSQRFECVGSPLLRVVSLIAATNVRALRRKKKRVTECPAECPIKPRI